jgi:hypothetical protein
VKLSRKRQAVLWVDADGVLGINTTAAQGEFNKWGYQGGMNKSFRCPTRSPRIPKALSGRAGPRAASTN